MKNDGYWSEDQILQASDTSISDNFGRAVDVYGDHIIVGAPDKNVNGVHWYGGACKLQILYIYIYAVYLGV